MFWPFRRRKKEEEKHGKGKVVAGLIFGAAIASIVGKKILDKHHEEMEMENENEIED